MYTFIISAVLGVIISWCLFGKNFNNNLTNVAITVFCVIFGGTLLASGISIGMLPTKRVFTKQDTLLPEYYKVFNKDTTIRVISLNKKGTKIKYNKIDTIINKDSLPQYFIIDKDGDINYLTNHKGSEAKHSHYLSNLTVLRIKGVSWFGIKVSEYVLWENKWVIDLSLPTKNLENILYLNDVQYKELIRRVANYNKEHDKNSQLVINK